MHVVWVTIGRTLYMRKNEQNDILSPSIRYEQILIMSANQFWWQQNVHIFPQTVAHSQSRISKYLLRVNCGLKFCFFIIFWSICGFIFHILLTHIHNCYQNCLRTGFALFLMTICNSLNNGPWNLVFNFYPMFLLLFIIKNDTISCWRFTTTPCWHHSPAPLPQLRWIYRG